VSTKLLPEGAWKRIRGAIRLSKKPVLAAIAYFGQGGAKRLPLRKGSRIVVDASEHAVRSGQTHPNSLLELHRKGVRIFSVGNLHAKVMVIGRRAFIGSANVSNRSEKGLVEAVVETTDESAVEATRQFVRDLCLQPLGPERLKELQGQYRPPMVPGGKRGNRARRSRERPDAGLDRTWLVHLVRREWTPGEWAVHDSGMREAKKRRHHQRTWDVDSFRWSSKPPYRRGDQAIVVMTEDSGRVLVDAPGTVLDSRRFEEGRRQGSFVYLERPRVRRKALALLARQIGRGSKKRLMRGGPVASGAFLERLLGAFAR
jgi:hypothetical protein